MSLTAPVFPFGTNFLMKKSPSNFTALNTLSLGGLGQDAEQPSEVSVDHLHLHLFQLCPHMLTSPCSPNVTSLILLKLFGARRINEGCFLPCLSSTFQSPSISPSVSIEVFLHPSILATSKPSPSLETPPLSFNDILKLP